MGKMDAYLLFLNKEKKLDRVFSGILTYSNNFRRFVGEIAECSNPDNCLKISEGKAGAGYINFLLSGDGTKYQVKLRSVSVRNPFGEVNIGLSGIYGEKNGDEADYKSVIASFVPKFD